MRCFESFVFNFGNLTPLQQERNETTFVKIRISTSEIRNNIKIQMFKIPNKMCLKRIFVLGIEIFFIRICLGFRYSDFEFKMRIIKLLSEYKYILAVFNKNLFIRP